MDGLARQRGGKRGGGVVWYCHASRGRRRQDNRNRVGRGSCSGFPRFAKGLKSGSFTQVVPASPGSQKLLTAQLVPGLPASQKLLTAQLVPESDQKLLETQLETSASACSSQQKVKRERPGRTPGIIETRPRMKRVKKEQDHEVVPPGFLVAYGHKLRCLHYVGRCWRLPGRDIKKWDFYGQQQPSSADYDHFCKHCWSKGAVPGGDSEAARGEADSGSSSTDAEARVKTDAHRHRKGRGS